METIKRAAIVGCGGIAQVHKKVLMAMPNVKLVACVDIKPDRAQKMADETGAKPYTDITEMLENEQIDVVHICTPHPLHTPLAKIAAAHGVNVFTEKPPVVNQEQWKEFEALKDSGVRVGICFQNRYNASTRRLIEILHSQEAGKVKGARAFVTWHRDHQYYQGSDWRGFWTTEGGGELINQSIHTLDLLVYLLGKPESVEAHMCNHSLKGIIEVEDTVEAYIGFESGVHALYYATNAHCMDAPVIVEIVCENVRLFMEQNDLTVYWNDGRVERPQLEQAEALGKGYWGNGHAACIADFYSKLDTDERYQNDIDSVRNTMALMIKMYDPYRGKTVE